MHRWLPMMMVSTVLLLWSVPAGAQGWRLLEKLSGPGDFNGYELDVKLWCKYQDENPPSQRKRHERLRAMFSFGVTGSLPCVFKHEQDIQDQDQPPSNRARALFQRGGSNRRVDLSKRIYAVGAGVSYLRGRSDLTYEPTDPPLDRTVQIITPEVFVDHQLAGRVDWGFAAGWYWFIVPTASNFSRASLESRFTFKLFDLQRANRFIGTASLRVGALWFPQSFSAADFGAIDGYHSRSEVVPSVRFLFDFDRDPMKSN